ncbi:MAG: hypothetical protein NTU79_13185 [Planctomycetota bacterium]|nr:hypothetical protein [Planctomycetota bacterium]
MFRASKRHNRKLVLLVLHNRKLVLLVLHNRKLVLLERRNRRKVLELERMLELVHCKS